MRRTLPSTIALLLLAAVPWQTAIADGGNGGCTTNTTTPCTPAAGGTPTAPGGLPGAPSAGGLGGSGAGGGGINPADGTGGSGGAGGNGAANGGGGGQGAAGGNGSGVPGLAGAAGGAGGTGGINTGGTLQDGAGGGGGGGGGAGVVIGADATNAGTVAGGNGGNGGGGGGNGSAQTGGGGSGGGGGEGGSGVRVTGTATGTNTGQITGGRGGNGGGGGSPRGTGDGATIVAGAGGGGGAGGNGVVANNGGTLVNTASGVIDGGNGANGGGAGSATSTGGTTIVAIGGRGGDAGLGGSGVFVTGGSTVQNDGAIAGGNGGNGENGGFGSGAGAVISGGGGLGGSGGQGAWIVGNGMITNAQGASIRGGNGGTGGGGSTLNVSGTGDIAGGLGADGGAGGAGVLLTGGGVVDNAGTIAGGNGNRSGGGSNATGGGAAGSAGQGGDGISLDGGGTVTNAATGQVLGGHGGDNSVGGGGGGGTGGNGIALNDGGSVQNAGTARGGNGGNGANANVANGPGGAGSAGGSGVLITGTGAVENIEGASIVGGDGGTGGGGNGTGIGGIGGAGGDGVRVTDGGTMSNAGSITGGNGNRGGGGGGPAGAGGIGVSGSNMTLVNSGSIIGGIAGNNGPRSDAVLFTGGTNTLELHAGSAITGNVDANTGSNTLALGGDDDSTFDASLIGPAAQYQGFTRYAKIGASTWSLTNSTDSVTPWTLYEGALRITDDAAVGDTSGTLTFDGGTLQLGASLALAATRPVVLAGGGGTIDTQAFTGTVSGVISGVGALTKEGSGTLILTGMDNYTGGTRIDGGVLQLGDGGTSGSIPGDVQNGGTLVFNRSDSVTFSGSINNGADGTPGRVVQAGTGTTLLTGVSTYSGGTEVNQGSLLVGDATHASASLAGGGMVDVAAAAAFGGYGTVVGDVTNAGTLVVADAAPALAGEGSGSFTVVGTLTHAGTANLAGAGAGNRLIVTNYVGSNATINLNTVVNGDDSPSDRLVIDGGTATGTTALRVTNAGGLGAATPGNGIMLVQAQAGALTAPGAFTLGNRVAAGPYLYTLFRGARDGSSTESWYLRSENTNPPPGITTPQVVPPTTLPPGETVPPVVPEYRPEVSLYTALPSMALNYGRALTGTLHERVGDEAQVPASQGDSVPSSAWARVVGQDGQWDARNGGIYRDGPSFDDNMVAVQAGADLWHDESDAHARDFAGVMGAVGHGHGRVDNFDGTTAGNDKFDAYTLGGYWTHYTPADAYIDGVLQGTWYHARATSPYHNEIKSNGFGWSASLEGGYPFKLAQDWTLEPQAQVIYQRLNLDSAHDDAGSVHFDNATSLVSRVGARLTHAWQPAGGTGRPTVGWLLANAWHESRGNAKTAFGSAEGDVPFHSDLGGSWWELGVGATTALGDRGSLYATVSYEKAFGDGVKAFNGTLGYRLNW